MKEYTEHFDSGFTHLSTGGCVSKSSPLVEAVGAVDELNSLLGMAISNIKDEEILDILNGIQEDLLTIGSDLANPIKKQTTLPGKHLPTKDMTKEDVKKMEGWMEKFEKELPSLTNFILPSGTPGAAALHMARAVTRRVERRIVAAKTENVNIEVLKYFNRLSDFLFTLARLVNMREGVTENIWNPRRKS